MYLLYSFLLTVTALVGLPFFVYRWVRTGKYGTAFWERVGFLPPSIRSGAGRALWVHAVSVGEVMAARSFLPLLRESFPDHPIFVSVTTSTGRQIAERQLRDASGILFCPFDWSFIVRRVVARLRPRALFLIDTEIWPHLIRACRRAGAATLLVNGRISDRSYPRYLWIRPFLKRYLSHVDRFCMQSALYAERIIELGAEPGRVRVTGSLKFDAVSSPRDEPSSAVHLVPSKRLVLVAGSTLAPEEEILLDAFQKLRAKHADLFLLLAPRHPERFGEVTELAIARGLNVARRTLLSQPPLEADVMVLDTIGELASIYARADVVFVGGSLATWGGHNPIEPAVHGKPIVFGPYMSNFREMATLFLEAGAAVQVQDRRELVDELDLLLTDGKSRDLLGGKARELVEANRGAGMKTIEIAREAMEDHR